MSWTLYSDSALCSFFIMSSIKLFLPNCRGRSIFTAASYKVCSGRLPSPCSRCRCGCPRSTILSAFCSRAYCCCSGSRSSSLSYKGCTLLHQPRLFLGCEKRGFGWGFVIDGGFDAAQGLHMFDVRLRKVRCTLYRAFLSRMLLAQTRFHMNAVNNLYR